MRNKLNLKEGEVQRILGLHKQAILKENNYELFNKLMILNSFFGKMLLCFL